MTLSELCIRRPVMTVLLCLAVIVTGIVLYPTIPIAALPSFNSPVIQVTATLPGASPETMAASVATQLEKQFATIPGVTVISSSNTLGNSSITIEFNSDRNIDDAAVDVQAALFRAQRSLPIEMTVPPSYRKVNPADAPVLLLAINSPAMSLAELNAFGDNLISPTLATLPGVAQVQVFGQKRFSVRVRAHPDALAARGLTLDELATALNRANANTPVGTLDGARQTLTIQANRQMTRPRRSATSSWPASRAAPWCGSRTWPMWKTASRPSRPAAGSTTSAPSCWPCCASRTPTPWPWWMPSRPPCPA